MLLHLRRYARFGGVLCVVIYLCLQAPLFLSTVLDTNKLPSPERTSWFTSHPGAEIPAFDDIAKGRWILSGKYRFEGQSPDPTKCTGNFALDRHKGIDYQSPQGIAISAARGQNISSWEYVLADGTPLVSWDARAWIENALQSRLGWYVIGDSLTEQLMHAVHGFLWPQPRTDASRILHPIRMTTATVPTSKGDFRYINTTTFSLSKQHPWYQELQAQYPHIPRERFDQPLLSFYRSYHLVSSDTLDELIVSVTNSSVSTQDSSPFPRMHSNWQASLANAADAKGWANETEAIIILNTGAHWSLGELRPATVEQALEIYELNLQGVYDSIVGLKDTFPIRIIYRSTAPAHQGCQTFEAPSFANDSSPLAPDPIITGWNWYQFNHFNHIAKRIFDNASGHENTARFRSTEYWDIWSMSVERPEAHRGWSPWGVDCMHWCQPGVPEWWARALWHRLSKIPTT